MANAAKKKQAASNIKALRSLHLTSLVINVVFLLSNRLLARPSSLIPYIVNSTPAFLLQFYLEKLGRPKYDGDGALLSAGDDLNLSGLTEYFFDIIYVTWACVILSVIFGTNKIWYLYLAIPGYALYLAYGLYKKSGFGARSAPPQEGGEDVKSKRQEKLEKRGGTKVKYR